LYSRARERFLDPLFSRVGDDVEPCSQRLSDLVDRSSLARPRCIRLDKQFSREVAARAVAGLMNALAVRADIFKSYAFVNAFATCGYDRALSAFDPPRASDADGRSAGAFATKHLRYNA
jgi:hypothetical protein